ncbi:MAG: TrkA family potassium uptake protein [Candidatus Saganbacteria bacterium]|nr:TrkA family potassium uptake protein [Candidatus Saganbacteria bacterium]
MSRKQYGILGLGRFGSKVARELYFKKQEVIVVDHDESKIQAIKDQVTHAFIGNIADEGALKESGIADCDVVIIAESSDIEANIMAAQLCKMLGIKKVICKAQNTVHGKILEKLQVDQVVYPEQDAAIKLVNKLASQKILDYLELGEHIAIIGITPLESFIGKSLLDLNLRSRYNITVLAVRRGGGTIINPTGETVIARGDILVVFGEEDALKRLNLDIGHKT